MVHAWNTLPEPDGLFKRRDAAVDLLFQRDVSSVLGKRPWFPCAAGILGGGKVGILILDFHFSMAHSSSSFLLFSSKIINRFSRMCTGTSGNRAQLGARPQTLAEWRFVRIA